MSGRNSARNSRGYVLFGVLVGITLLGVGLSAGVTLWSQLVQREREAELLFRGEAVVRALERFQQDRPGTLPETLEELVEGKYLRRAWVDPMTGRSFRILRAQNAAAGGGSGPGRERRGRAGGGPAPTNPAGEEGPRRAAGGVVREEPGEAGTAGEPATGITGVVSTSDLLSFRSYEGARRYNEWRFEAQVGAAAGGGSPGRGAVRPRGRNRALRAASAGPTLGQLQIPLYPRRANASSPARGQVFRST